MAGNVPNRWLRRFWERMAIMYSSWVAANGQMPQDAEGKLTLAGEVWRDSLVGLDGPQLQLGLQRCLIRHPKWPPGPGEFRELCFDIPSLAEVEADMRLPADNRSAFTLLVGQHLDWTRYASMRIDQQQRLLSSARDAARDHVLRGGVLPAKPAAALTADSKPKPARRVAMTQAEFAAKVAELDFTPRGEEPEDAEYVAPRVRKDAAAGPDA